MAAQPAAVGEALHESVQDTTLLVRELVGTGRLKRREVTRDKLAAPPADPDGARGGVDATQQEAVRHVELGMARNKLAGDLEHDDGDGLLAGGEHVLLRIGLLGKEGELSQGDAIGALEDVERLIVDAVAHDRGHARLGAGRRAHPADVVVAPLDVERVVGHEPVDDVVAMGASVIEVSHDVHVVDSQPLDECGEAADEVAHAARLDNGVNNARVVGGPTRRLARARVEKLVDDVGVGDGHRLAHLGAGVGV